MECLIESDVLARKPHLLIEHPSCCLLSTPHITHWTVHYRISHSNTQSQVQNVIFHITKWPLAMRKQQQFLSPLQIKNKFRKCTYHISQSYASLVPPTPVLPVTSSPPLHISFTANLAYSNSNSSPHSSSSTSATQQPPGEPQANNTKKCKKWSTRISQKCKPKV